MPNVHWFQLLSSVLYEFYRILNVLFKNMDYLNFCIYYLVFFMLIVVFLFYISTVLSIHIEEILISLPKFYECLMT